MGGRPHAALGFVLAALVLAPPAVASEDPVTIPAPRGGDAATYLRETSDGSFDDTFRWHDGLRLVRDGSGVERLVYAMTVPFGADPWLVEAGLRAYIGATSTESSLRETALERAETTRREEWRTLWYEPLWVAQGRALAAGDEFTLDEGGGFRIPVVVAGWESKEGARLFRVDVGGTSVWFDGVLPVPVRAEHPGLVSRLLSFEPGSGAPLADATYAPPPIASVRVDAATVAYTADGPDAEFGGFGPREAAAAVRAHPLASDWFAAHPAAYLADGHRSESAEWSLAFVDGASGHDRLSAAVARDHPLAPALVTNVRAFTVHWGAPPSSDVVGADSRCAHAGTLAAESVGEAAPWRLVHFRVWSEGAGACRVARGGDAHVAEVRVGLFHGRLEDSTETRTTRILLPGLADLPAPERPRP